MVSHSSFWLFLGVDEGNFRKDFSCANGTVFVEKMYGYLGLRAGTQSCFAGEKVRTLLGAGAAHCENDVGGTTCENIKDKNKKTVKQFIGILSLFKAKSTSGESLEGIYTF